MKRYILLLALVGMQANVTLPIFEGFKSKVCSFFGSLRTNSVKSTEPVKTVPTKIEEKKLPSRVVVLDFGESTDEFEKRVDYLVDKKNLDMGERSDLYFVRSACSNYVKLLREAKPSFPKEVIEEEGAECIADFAGFQKVHDYKQTIPWPRYTSATKQAYKQTIHEIKLKEGKEAYDKYKSGVFGSLKYLFDNPVRKYVIEKTERMAEQRVSKRMLQNKWLNDLCHGDFVETIRRSGRVPPQCVNPEFMNNSI
jgi:hypothetical protein